MGPRKPPPLRPLWPMRQSLIYVSNPPPPPKAGWRSMAPNIRARPLARPIYACMTAAMSRRWPVSPRVIFGCKTPPPVSPPRSLSPKSARPLMCWIYAPRRAARRCNWRQPVTASPHWIYHNRAFKDWPKILRAHNCTSNLTRRFAPMRWIGRRLTHLTPFYWTRPAPPPARCVATLMFCAIASPGKWPSWSRCKPPYWRAPPIG